jgi:Protein of unknown function (DUF938)
VTDQPTPVEPQYSAPAERNRAPILEALQKVLPLSGLALEIASGTGQHVAHFAANLPGWVWQPSDATAKGFASIAAWCAQAGVANVREPVVVDVQAPVWPFEGTTFSEPFDAIYCANMLHISPWATCAGLMQGASRHLSSQGILITYGPYLESDRPTSPGNVAFDADLRQRNPQWGIRTLESVQQQAALAGLKLQQRFQMPANNLLLVFKRRV